MEKTSRVSRRGNSRQYQSPRSVNVWVQAVTGAKSEGAAHQRVLRLEATWRQYLFAMRLAGNRDALARCLAMTQAECDNGPITPIRQALLNAGASERKEAECREAAALGDMTTQELRNLERALNHDNAVNLQTIRSIRAELDLRR